MTINDLDPQRLKFEIRNLEPARSFPWLFIP